MLKLSKRQEQVVHKRIIRAHFFDLKSARKLERAALAMKRSIKKDLAHIEDFTQKWNILEYNLDS